MSFPNIPDVSPTIDIKPEDVVSLLLASVAFEELGLAHLLNAEGEKLQAAIGIILCNPNSNSVNSLLAVNKSVSKFLRDVIFQEMLLQMKFDNILDYLNADPCHCRLSGCGASALLGGARNEVDATGPALRYIYQSPVLPPPGVVIRYELEADPATTTYICRIINGVKTATVQGTGNIKITDDTGVRVIPGGFSLNVADTGTGTDSFIMLIKSTDGTVDFNSGVVNLTEGDLIITCD